MFIGRSYVPIPQYEVKTDFDVYFGIVFVIVLLIIIYKLGRK